LRERALALLLAAQLGCGAGVEDPAEDAAGGAAEAEAEVWFVEESAARGLDFVHESGHRGPYLLPEITCGGAALFDADGDGDLDAYLVQFGGLATQREQRPPNRLFLNDGSGRFVDATADSGAGDRGAGNGVACGDVDGDGDLDLFVTNVGADVLLLGDGRGRFTDGTSEFGLGDDGWGTSAAFFDLEGDGDLDLFVTRYVSWRPSSERACPGPDGTADYCLPAVYDAPTTDLLYRNDGGVFTDVSVSSGIAGARGTGLGVLPADFDGDGRPDVFVANDGMPDRLWIQVDEGRFEDRALVLGCAVDQEGQAKAGMGVAAEDLDGDGDLDLLVGNLTGESDSLFRNELSPGGGRFDDVTARARLSAASRARTRFGLGLHDLDRDGELDLFEASGRVTRPPRTTSGDPYAEENLLLRGEPGLRFRAPVAGGGTRPPLVATSRAAAFGDVDGDGAVDVLIVNRDAPAHLLLNRAPSPGRWLLVDVRDRRGAPALGAVVTVEAGPRSWRRDVRSAGSYQAASDPRPHFGLGDLARVEALTVRWPDGGRARLLSPRLDGILRVEHPGP
jgi:hypothetical protein